MSYIRDHVQAMLNEGWDQKPTGEAGKELHRRVVADRRKSARTAKAVRLEAKNVLGRWLFEEARRTWVRESKNAAGVMSVAYNGAVIGSPPRAYSVRDRDVSGAPLKTHQLRLWLDFERPQFQRFLDDLIALAEGVSSNVAALTHLNVLWNQYPNAKTVRAVCVCAGIDPDSIDIEGVS
jgi:hypothetical protein